ncbi:alkane 1-monooxygenase [Candidatus Marinimicrobia bacterium]|nr:alkane 1-monooxygenase [Candidatus Neomarinimicrobiota bacterium]
MFSSIFIFGDLFIKRDKEIQSFTYPVILDLSIYLALPILFILVFFIASIFSNSLPTWYINGFKTILNVDFIQLQNSFNLVDKISIIFQGFLITGVMSLVSGHEMAHRKKNKFDLFIGNWLLAFSCDCNFAIEHVYGHHKNVCLPEDPASAKRGENIYTFILRAIVNEQISGWELESRRLKRKKISFFTVKNRMLKGYLRSIIIALIILGLFGISAMLVFFLLAFLSKVSLEAINYVEHYGLVREKGKPVRARHSWNSNHVLSSIYLYNVSRHSDHHKNTNLKFWELNPILKDAPILPYGYLSMLYLILFFPFIYKRIMKKELVNWDQNYANDFERNLVNSL